MSNDRSWMYRKVGEKAKHFDQYLKGVEEFLDFAFSHPECVDGNTIRCPSAQCEFLEYKTRNQVQKCLLKHGFVSDYTRWTNHGESLEHVEIDDSLDEEDGSWPREMLIDAAGPSFEFREDPNGESRKFYELFKAADEQLWEGCEKHTKLSATTLLLHIKNEYGMSNSCFDALLLAIKEMLPENEKLPQSYYRCKALMKDLGLPFHKIHACENDCVLFRKEYADSDVCPKCQKPRYKNHDKAKVNKTKPIPNKVLRYFPITPRLKRLFESSKTAEHMRWHKEKRRDIPGELRHPADGEAWKDFDRKFPSFADDSRSIRLVIATDGFNPFGPSNKPHSIWPVFVVPYNLPPWMCMKEEYMFMSLVIPGPNSPGRDIDVYLQPLIDELKILWDIGVSTYDSFSQTNFKMRATVLWTISDFPALAMLKGWSTHGCLSCPVCMDKDVTFYLKNSKKPCYFGAHRRWLRLGHHWRRNKNKFNNKTEMRAAPRRKTGAEELDFVSQFGSISLGKGKGNNEKFVGFGIEHNHTKKSIFFELPYWSSLLIRHNLDVMHIEKNVFDNVFNTVMNVQGKTKDHLKARLDLQELGIRPELQPVETNGGKLKCPKASYTLTNDQIRKVCKWLKSLKVPDGYAANISRCVNLETCKITGLKSHDCHVLMERFLPIAFSELPKAVWEPLNALSQFFRDICSKVYKEEELEKLEAFIIDTLCKLEMIFPPSFFDSMEHLPIHLAYEAKMGGPVQYRWMYPFERCMFSLKRKVRNKACPEGSIAEAYRIDELVYFCSRYFDLRVKTKFNRKDRNDDGGEVQSDQKLSIFSHSGKPLGSGDREYLTDEDYEAAHLYILSNCKEVEEFVEEHMQLLKEIHPNVSDGELKRIHNMTFTKWFESRVSNDDKIDSHLRLLAMGPSKEVTYYNGFIVNGFRFHTKDMEHRKATQNSGVLVKGSAYNANEIDYYGHLVKVIGLEYYGQAKNIFLFKCDWYDVQKGVQCDKYGYTRVNTKSRLRANDPFVLASQVVQVFYADPISTKDKGWSIVIPSKARNVYDIVENSDLETYQEEEAPIVNLDCFDNDEIEDLTLVDNAEPGVEVDPTMTEEAEDDAAAGDDDDDEIEDDADDDEIEQVVHADPDDDDF